MRNKVRVLVGSDGVEVRGFLSGLVEKQTGIVVGQAENALGAVGLAKSLRPDVVILDCHLPYTLGVRGLPLSRAGGLDAAQTIAEEIPNICVILIGNIDAPPPLEIISNPEVVVSMFEDDGGGSNMPLLLNNLAFDENENLIFTRISIQQPPVVKGIARLAEGAVLYGTVGILFGLIMMVTGLLIIPGVTMALLGGVSALAGFAVKMAHRYLAGQGKNNEG